MMIENDLNPLLQGKQAYPLMVVISGPSGVGKDALLLRLRELDEAFHFVVTATSRPPRPNEQHGVDYFFYDKAGFELLIEQQELVEWAELHNNIKYTTKTIKFKYRVCFEDDATYTYFQLTWPETAWQRYRIVQDLNNR